jgi:hypothetical protein
MRVGTPTAFALLAVVGLVSFNSLVHARCGGLWDPNCKDLAPEDSCCSGGGGGVDAGIPLPAAPPPAAEAPAAAPPEATAPSSASVDVADGQGAIDQATSVFVEPHDYPPREYGAYGIVAFPSAPTSNTRSRFIRVCEAYVATLPPASTATVPLDRQMVTVWR